MSELSLTEQDIDFCDLFVNGGFGIAGDRYACYKESFGKDDKKAARLLSSRPEIKEKIKELIEDFKNDETNIAIALKIKTTDTLEKVMMETANDVYKTPKGHVLSPAPLRSVAVNAAKALADLYPMKPSQTQKLQIEGAGDGGIVFNVVVPIAKQDEATAIQAGK